MPKNIAQRGVIVPRFPLGTGRWYGTNWLFPGAGSTLALAANTHYAAPFAAAVPATMKRIGLYVTATGTAVSVRLGIYAADPVTLLPTTLLRDSGAVAVGTLGQKDNGSDFAQAFVPGTLYWLTVVADGTVTVNSNGGSINLLGGGTIPENARYGLTRALTFGALPDPFGTGSLSYVGSIPYVALQAV